jgi:hypothetical protein
MFLNATLTRSIRQATHERLRNGQRQCMSTAATSRGTDGTLLSGRLRAQKMNSLKSLAINCGPLLEMSRGAFRLCRINARHDWPDNLALPSP